MKYTLLKSVGVMEFGGEMTLSDNALRFDITHDASPQAPRCELVFKTISEGVSVISGSFMIPSWCDLSKGGVVVCQFHGFSDVPRGDPAKSIEGSASITVKDNDLWFYSDLWGNSIEQKLGPYVRDAYIPVWLRYAYAESLIEMRVGDYRFYKTLENVGPIYPKIGAYRVRWKRDLAPDEIPPLAVYWSNVNIK